MRCACAARNIGVAVRGGLWWQGDGSRPWIDLAAQIDDTQVTVAKHFWVRHLMPKGTIDWLDNALVAGMLRDGRAVVSGDLDDWPFRDHDGLFRADAHIADATLKFQPDWPAAEQVEGDVSFIADGFTVDGKGAIAGVGIRQFHAGIPRFSAAELTVQAQGGADASKLIGLLKQSPVQKEHAETLANVSASGPAAVTFDMLLPMHRKPGASARRFGGTVELRDASLREQALEAGVRPGQRPRRIRRGRIRHRATCGAPRWPARKAVAARRWLHARQVAGVRSRSRSHDGGR